MTGSDTKTTKMVDGNEAAASVAHRMNEVSIIYPITPSSGMGELADAWSAQNQMNIWGMVPEVTEMQSEAGAAGAVHGALQVGSLVSTFTASQGLLLMIPNMYKIAGELTSYVMHVSARSIATHALSIFGDHSDVMSCRQTGFALLASGSIQEAQDFACISQLATLKSRVPFLHFFDGFRTSHEISKITYLSDDELRAMNDDKLVSEHRSRALTPDAPVVRGTAQNPDVFFQARESCNPFYDACAGHVEDSMKKFAEVTGRKYGLIDYVGHAEAERVIVLMGSGAEAAHETVEHMVANGEKVGLVKVRLYRPFPSEALLKALPKTVKSISVLDRTKEPGATGEPLYLDVVTAIAEDFADGSPRLAKMPAIVGGRYGLSSKEFTPAMVKGVFDNSAAAKSKNHFTVGINDDLTNLSLDYDESFETEASDVKRAVFYGLGSDGTVGANKNSIKIIAKDEKRYGQGYFVYDSKKAGAITVSHLRFSPRPIHSTYLIKTADFVACHHFPFVEKLDVLKMAIDGATFLLNAPYKHDEVWNHLPKEMQEDIISKKLKFYVIDAAKVAAEAGMGRRINTVMQTCFFALSGVLPRDEAIAQIKEAIQKTYGKKSQAIVEKNFAAVDASLAHLHEIKVPASATTNVIRPSMIPESAPDFVKKVTGVIMEGRGDELPVSAFTPDGTWPVGTTKYEKRCVANEIPVWNPENCIQCGKCAIVCPHAAIRAKVASPENANKAPEGMKFADYKAKDFKGDKWIIQVSPEDCTGCNLCVDVCPAKNKALELEPVENHLEAESKNFNYFLSLPEVDRTKLSLNQVKHTQLLEPLFEFSGACAGCGETQYVKLLSQLFGDRAIIANATGCSSIYGGNLPTTPYSVNAEGRGPAWSNSLFEDNAEFGLGMRIGIDKKKAFAEILLKELSAEIGEELVNGIIGAKHATEEEIASQRANVKTLKSKLSNIKGNKATMLKEIADFLVHKSVWLVGGDGWAYDIGFGGIDHAFGLNRNVNILVMDTEVYSNTGGQQSKATPMCASAKFAAAGRELQKKDLGMIAMSYETVYVAKIALGAKDAQTIKAFREAEAYEGTSLIIAYSHCISHGIDMSKGLQHQKMAVESGHWPLYRYDPRLLAEGKAPLQLDSGDPKTALSEFMNTESRFKIVEKQDPKRFKSLLEKAEHENAIRRDMYKHMADFSVKS